MAGLGGTGGLLSNTWIKTGPGTLTNSPGLVTIVSDGVSYTSAAQEVTVNPGKLHRFSYNGVDRTFSRKIGAAQEGAEYLDFASGVLGENSHTFTPATNKVWVQFQRLSANTATAGSLRLVDMEPLNNKARSLNGSSQYFFQDNLTYEYPMLNASFFIGAWWNFTALPSGMYLYDYGVPNSVNTGGVGRVRLVYDGAQNRLVASNMANTTPSNYREHYLANPGLAINTPVFIGLAVLADGDPYPIIGTRRGGGTISGGLPMLQNDLGRQLTIGATSRTTPAAATYVPASIWDVVWNYGSIPSDAILTSLANGQRPHQISGFAPTYHWPMAATANTKDEESIAGLSTLRQVGSPALVAPPVVVEPTIPETMGFIII